MPAFHRWASILLATLAACAPAPDATQTIPTAAAPIRATAPATRDPGAGPDDGAIELPPDTWHGNWRVAAADDPHDQALLAISIQSSAGEPQGSGDYVLFQPFCDAADGQPITGTSDCELIDQGAAFSRVQAEPERLLLVFQPTADGAEQRLELRRDGDRLIGDYVADANGIRRAITAERAPDDVH